VWHKRGEYDLKVHCIVPEGAVISADFSALLPSTKSKLVQGALKAEAFTVRKDGSAVLVFRHVRVKNPEALYTTKAWCVQVVEGARENRLDLLLTPAPKGASATVGTLWLQSVSKAKRTANICFHVIKLSTQRSKNHVRPVTCVGRRLRQAVYFAQTAQRA